jgi:hypothetical protein
MDVDEAVEAAEEFYSDFEVQVDGKPVALALRKVKSDEDVVTVHFTVDGAHLEDDEPTEDLRAAVERTLDDFREAFPELGVSVEFEYVAKR